MRLDGLEEQLGSQADIMEMTEHLSMSPSHSIGFQEENLEVDLLDSTVGTIRGLTSGRRAGGDNCCMAGNGRSCP